MAMTESWNFTDPAAKETVLRVLRAEIAGMFDLVHDPARWEAATACEGWQVRDVIGHLVDATEGYFPGFDVARSGGTLGEPLGLRAMPKLADEHAKAFRKVPQDEMLDRLRDDSQRMLRELEELSDDEWTGLTPFHPYMGPLPAMFYSVFQLVDYTVHGWDVREGRGRPHTLAGDAADLLVPVIFVLLQATADTSGVTEPYGIGIRVTGRNGGDTRLDVSSDGVQYAPGEIDDCPAILEFDPASFVLTAYGRINGGTVRGDQQLAQRFRSLFFAI